MKCGVDVCVLRRSNKMEEVETERATDSRTHSSKVRTLTVQHECWDDDADLVSYLLLADVSNKAIFWRQYQSHVRHNCMGFWSLRLYLPVSSGTFSHVFSSFRFITFQWDPQILRRKQ